MNININANHPYPSEFVVAFWREGKTVMGKGYWYVTPPIDWEDGNWHQLEFIFTSESLDIIVDDISVFNCTEDTVDPYLPLPPMYFYIGGRGIGTQTSGYSFIIDEIEHQTLVVYQLCACTSTWHV